MQCQFLLSHLKPSKEIQKSTLTSLVKIVLRKADIDTSQFKTHSCRLAATSKATAMGISLEGVLKDGNDQVNQHGRNIIISLLKGMKLLKQQF